MEVLGPDEEVEGGKEHLSCEESVSAEFLPVGPDKRPLAHS